MNQETIGTATQMEKANQLLQDLIDYTKRPRDLVIARSKCAMVELAWQWKDHKDDKAYYRDTDLYIFDLTKYQSQLVIDVDMIIEELKVRGLKKVLDFGGGIGEYTIRAIQEAKCDVTFLDLKDSQTLAYAKYRFTKHKVSPKIIDEDYPWQAEAWDAVIVMDVIEHLNAEEAKRTLDALRQHAKYVIANPEYIKFNDLFPQHITHYTLEGFERVGTMLWKNKNDNINRTTLGHK